MDSSSLTQLPPLSSFLSLPPSSPCPGAVWVYRTPSQRWATRPSRSVPPPCPPQLLTSRASACLTWWWGCSTTPRTPSPGWGRVSEAHAVMPLHPDTKKPRPDPPIPQNILRFFCCVATEKNYLTQLCVAFRRRYFKSKLYLYLNSNLNGSLSKWLVYPNAIVLPSVSLV